MKLRPTLMAMAALTALGPPMSVAQTAKSAVAKGLGPEEIAEGAGAPLGVAAGPSAEQKDLVAYQRDHNLQMPSALDETGAFFRAYKVADVPSFGRGRVIGRAQTADEANRIAEKALPADPQPKEKES